MKTASRLKVNDAISGTYMGVPFSGVVTATRQHTCNFKVTLLSIKLDSEITIFKGIARAERTASELGGLWCDESNNNKWGKP